MPSERDKTRRRWQFSLRTLLRFMLVVGSYSGGWIANERKRKSERDALPIPPLLMTDLRHVSPNFDVPTSVPSGEDAEYAPDFQQYENLETIDFDFSFDATAFGADIPAQ